MPTPPRRRFPKTKIPEGRCYLCIAPHYWGKAFTPADAEANAAKEAGGRDRDWKFIMLDAPPDCVIDDMGSTVYTPALYYGYYGMDDADEQMANDPDPAFVAKLIGYRPKELYRFKNGKFYTVDDAGKESVINMK